MNCNKCRIKISEFVDSRLSVNEAEEFLTHIESCPACKKELEETQKALDELAKAKEYDLPHGFYARMRENLDKADEAKKAPAFNWLPVVRATAGAFALIAVTFLARQVYKEEINARFGSRGAGMKVAEQGAPAAAAPASQLQDKAEPGTVKKDIAELKPRLEALSVSEKRKMIQEAKMMRSAAPAKSVELSEADSMAAADEAMPSAGAGANYAEAPAAAVPAEPAAGAEMYSKAEAAPQVSVKKAPAPRLLEWQGIEGSRYEGCQEIRTKEELDSILASNPGIINENPALARFDFTDRMLVVIFAGEKPTAGYRVQIHDFDFIDSSWVVNYSVVTPPAGSLTAQVITKPYLVRSFKKTEYGMEFVKH